MVEQSFDGKLGHGSIEYNNVAFLWKGYHVSEAEL